MSTPEPPPWTPESERVYWRNYLAKMDADAKKAEHEAKWYPWIALLLGLIASAPFWAAMAVLFGFLKITVNK